MTRINVSLRVLACASALAAPALIAELALAQSNRPASLEREPRQATRDGAPILSVRIREEAKPKPTVRIGQVGGAQDVSSAGSPAPQTVAPEQDAEAAKAADAAALAQEETSGSEPAESADGAIDVKSKATTADLQPPAEKPADRGPTDEKPSAETANDRKDSAKTSEDATEPSAEDATPPAEKPTDKPSPNGVDGSAAKGEAAAEPAPLVTPRRTSDDRPVADENSAKNDENKAAPPKDAKEPRTLGSAPDAVAVPTFEQDLTPELLELRDRVRKTLSWYYNEPISVNSYSPWGIMHALIAFGVDTQVYNQDQKVNAIGWLCYNNACRGQRLMYLENGKLRVDIGVGVQGHAGQFLAMLAQSRVRTDFPIKVEGRDFTVADLIESEKETCRTRTELTFKLIGLAHYLKTDATWKSDIGEEWSIPKLIKEELAQPVVGSACGGTHRMTGFSYAVNKRTKLNEPFEGQWLRGRKFVHAYHEYIFKLQNSDGSFSTNWFAGRGDTGEIKRHLETTGHMLEWLVCSLPADQLDDPRVIQAVDHLTSVFEYGMRNGVKWEIGPRGHGLHALALYAERRFGDKPGSREAIFARRNPTKPLVR